VKDDAHGARAVERAVDVLAALAAAGPPQSLTTVAERAGLGVPTTFRLLRTLRRQRLAEANEHGRYLLGARAGADAISRALGYAPGGLASSAALAGLSAAT
jgi:DNA-binding IclR family transcriptional regulator